MEQVFESDLQLIGSWFCILYGARTENNAGGFLSQL